MKKERLIMKLYQVIDGFIHSYSHSSIYSICQQVKNLSYQELTDFFKKEYLSQELINEVKEKLFIISSGYLMFDEIVLSKSKQGVTNFVKRRYKSTEGYVVPGVSIVVLVWTDGNLRIPVRFRIQINGEKATSSALHLLSWYRNKISRQIYYVAFDSGFASKNVFKRLNDYGWCFVTRLPKSRQFNGKKIFKTHRGGYWNKIGILSDGTKVKAVRRKDKFYITNRINLPAKKIEEMYRKRAIIEEVFRVLKQECHWSRCQLRDYKAYENYYIIGILSFLCLEYMRIKGFGHTIYRIHRNVLFSHLNCPIADFKKVLV
jgi:hypothetical protein